MAIFLTSKQWGRAKIRLPKRLLIAKAKKASKFARPGQTGLVEPRARKPKPKGVDK